MSLENLQNLEYSEIYESLMKVRLDILPLDEFELEYLEAEFLVYKQELIEQEEARLAEEARQEDLLERWGILKARDAGVPSFYKIKQSISNPEYYMVKLILDSNKKEEAELLMLELEAEDLIIKESLSKNEYKGKRSNEFGNLADQLDEIYHDIVAWKARIKSIKDKYPKG